MIFFKRRFNLPAMLILSALAINLPAQGGANQALVDGVLSYSPHGESSLTLEGAAARALFSQLSNKFEKPGIAGDPCSRIISRVGQNYICHHCETAVAPDTEARGPDEAIYQYWCVFKIEGVNGKILQLR